MVGDAAGGLYGLASGKLSVMSAPQSVPHHLIKISFPGWWFGDVALITKSTRVVTTVARTDVEIAVVSRSAILQAAERDPETWRRIAEITAQHLKDALSIIGAMSLTDAEARIAFALSRFCEDVGRAGDQPIEVNVTRSELGEMARMTRNALAPALNRLEDYGLVRCGYRSVAIPSIRALWDFLETRPEIEARAWASA